MTTRRSGTPLWSFVILGLIALLAVSSSSSPASAEVLLRVGGGFVAPTGEVGDELIGGGLDAFGEALIGLSDNIFIGGGGHLSFLSGKSVTGDDGNGGPQMTTELTDSGGRFSLEGIGLFYLSAPDASVRPYLAAGLGFGALAWNYSSEAATFFGVSSDAVGFVYFAPTVGLEIAISPNTGIFGSIRYSITSYSDDTQENWKFDLSGGNFLELSAGLAFTL